MFKKVKACIVKAMRGQKTSQTKLTALLGSGIQAKQRIDLLGASFTSSPPRNSNKQLDTPQRPLTIRDDVRAGDHIELVLTLSLMLNEKFDPTPATELNKGTYKARIVEAPNEGGLWLALRLRGKNYMRPLSVIFSKPESYRIFKLPQSEGSK